MLFWFRKTNDHWKNFHDLDSWFSVAMCLKYCSFFSYRKLIAEMLFSAFTVFSFVSYSLYANVILLFIQLWTLKKEKSFIHSIFTFCNSITNWTFLLHIYMLIPLKPIFLFSAVAVWWICISFPLLHDFTVIH